MKRRGWMCAVAVLVWLGSAGQSSARDLEEILKDKGLLNDKEAMEARQKEGANTASTSPSLPAWISKITPFGDVRVRYEGFRRSGDPDRDRFRTRLRVGAKVGLTEETEAGFRLATGNPDDPISNNETLTDSFKPKNINLSTAYLKIAPAASFGLTRPIATFLGGKFDIPLFRPSESVFDSDLTPEGFHEMFRLLDSQSGFLRSVELQGAQWSAKEVAAGSDAWIFGGQGIVRLKPASAIGVTLSGADYGFTNADLLAAERNTNSALTITNDVQLSDGTTAGGRKIDPQKLGPNKNGLDAAGKPIRIVGFTGGFNILDVASRLDFDTGLASWPLAVFGDYAKNSEAKGGEDTAFAGGLEVGICKKRGDVLGSYSYTRKETN